MFNELYMLVVDPNNRRRMLLVFCVLLSMTLVLFIVSILVKVFVAAILFSITVLLQLYIITKAIQKKAET